MTAETKTKTSNETKGKARILYIIWLLAVRWVGSYNDNVLSALPWVCRHLPWWNKVLGIRVPSSGRHGREVLLVAHFVSVLCVALRDFQKIWIHIISIHMFIWIHICRIRTAYLWQITWIVLRDVFLASIFLAYVEPKLFFRFRARK
jgi:hypothetical protein